MNLRYLFVALPRATGVVPAPAAVGAFALLYLAGAWLGHVLMVADVGIALWPPSGLFLGVLVRCAAERRAAWLVTGVAIDLVASVGIFHFPLWVATLIALGNALEAGVGAALLNRWARARGRASFELCDTTSVLMLVLFAGVCATALSALVGGSALSVFMNEPLLSSWRLWLTGDAAGLLVVAPLVLTLDWATVRAFARSEPRRHSEFAALLLLLLACGYAVFHAPYPVTFLLLPAVLWAALRHGFVGSALVCGIVVVQAILYQVSGYGPFASWPKTTSQLLLQLFAFANSVTGLLVAAVARQSREVRAALQAASEAAERTVQVRTTQLVTREAQLREALALLETADRRKDDFLACVAHELANPLGPLHNGLELLDEPLDAQRSAQVRQMMARQLRHLDRLVKDLLDLARIKTGKVDIQFAPVDLRQVVNEAVEMLRQRIEDKSQLCTVDLQDDVPSVRGDRARLVQVVVNLVGNASRYTPAEGHIRIGLRADEESAQIIVTDNGPGIAAHRLATIFTLYEQGVRERNEGLGIGLALVQRIVHLHGGRVDVASDFGSGTTFVVRLPLKLQQPLGTDSG